MKLTRMIAAMLAGMFLLVGCGNNTTEHVDGSLDDIITMIYEDVPEEQKPMMLTNTEVTDENEEYFLGTDDLDYKEALACESSVGSIAYSVVLVRAEENADIEKLKTEIKKNIDPNKWVCVGVDAKNIVVDNIGDLIIVIMVDDASARGTLQKGFEKLRDLP